MKEKLLFTITLIFICLIIMLNGCGGGEGMTYRERYYAKKAAEEASSSKKKSGKDKQDVKKKSGKDKQDSKKKDGKPGSETTDYPGDDEFSDDTETETADNPEDSKISSENDTKKNGKVKFSTVRNDDTPVSSWSPEGSREDYGEQFGEKSGFYRKLSSGENVNVLINGDSIGAGGGSTAGNSWTDLLKEYIETEYQVSCNMTNISMGGNQSYAGYVRESILDDDTAYDLMVICYGENDDTKAVPAEYEALIRGAMRKYPSCNMISILESSQRDYTKKIEAIEELCEYYDIPTADTIAAFNESGREYNELTVDVKHPNDEGYRLYFETVKKVIESEVKNDSGVDCIARKPANPESSVYESFRYFPAGEFVRKDPLTYELSLKSPVNGVIGLYHLFCPSSGEIVIKADGKEIIRRPMEWTQDYSADFIYKHDNIIRSARESIEISFPTVELSEGFKGMVFSSP